MDSVVIFIEKKTGRMEAYGSVTKLAESENVVIKGKPKNKFMIMYLLRKKGRIETDDFIIEKKTVQRSETNK